MNRAETSTKLYEMMDRVGGHRIAICDGPNKGDHPGASELEFWVVGKRLVIVQVYKNGGCDHYIQSETTQWDEMERELADLVPGRDLR